MQITWGMQSKIFNLATSGRIPFWAIPCARWAIASGFGPHSDNCPKCRSSATCTCRRTLWTRGPSTRARTDFRKLCLYPIHLFCKTPPPSHMRLWGKEGGCFGFWCCKSFLFLVILTLFLTTCIPLGWGCSVSECSHKLCTWYSSRAVLSCLWYGKYLHYASKNLFMEEVKILRDYW